MAPIVLRFFVLFCFGCYVIHLVSFGFSQKTGGDEDGTVATLPPEGWVAIPGAVIVREKHEKKSNTRDEIDERLETEEVHHLGHLTNQVSYAALLPFRLFISRPRSTCSSHVPPSCHEEF